MTAELLSGCVIVSGMPGAGKTTVTSLAGRLLPRAARVSGDDVNRMVCSGYVWFMGKPAHEALRQDELCNRNMCSLANNFIDFGFTVLMDTVVADRAELDFFLALLAPRPVRLVILAPGVDACRERNRNRDREEQFDFDGYDRLDADMRREFADCAWWFDTVALTPEKTAEQFVQGVVDLAVELKPTWNAWLRQLRTTRERPVPRAGSGNHVCVADLRRDFMKRCAEIEGAALGEGAFSPGPAIWVGRREVAHFDGPVEVDVRLTKGVIRERRSQLVSDEHVELRPRSSDWVRVRVASPSELDSAFALVRDAVAANLPSSKPGLPPSGPDLERLRRFH
jgi:predicted kinase